MFYLLFFNALYILRMNIGKYKLVDVLLQYIFDFAF